MPEKTLPPDTDAAPAPDQRADAAIFPIVGVGASAGGLEAFTHLLTALPPDTGMAFVLVQHLSPTHASALAEILSRATRMPVLEVHDGMAVEPDHVYVIPPGGDMVIEGGRLQLLPRQGGRGAHHPVDRFFRALAEERRHQAIGVVLSGSANDGTAGLASRPRAASPSRRTTRPSTRACRTAPSHPAAWTWCCRPSRSRASWCASGATLTRERSPTSASATAGPAWNVCCSCCTATPASTSASTSSTPCTAA